MFGSVKRMFLELVLYRFGVAREFFAADIADDVRINLGAGPFDVAAGLVRHGIDFSTGTDRTSFQVYFFTSMFPGEKESSRF